MERSKYEREIVGLNGERAIVDVYRTLSAFNVTDPACQHAIIWAARPQRRYNRP